MKKVMIGILILIPIIILLIVLAVGAIVSIDAYFAVESIEIIDDDGNQIKNVTISTSELNDGVFDIMDYINLRVLPEKATNKTVDWTIEELKCFDTEYEQAYEYYINHKDEVSEVKPAAIMIDENGLEVPHNSTGKVEIRTYCSFILKASAGVCFAYVKVEVVGFDVEKVVVKATVEVENLTINDTVRLVANYTPIDSKVTYFAWASDNEAVATVDENGVVTAHSVGTANITHKASVYSSEEEDVVRYIESAPLTITVEEGASTVWGNSVTTSRLALSLNELGLADGFEVVSGGVLVGDELTVTDETVVLRKGDAEFVIRRCEVGSIAIKNAGLYDNRDENNQFILESGEKPFNLQVVWQDMMQEAALTGVVWTSSNTRIATVDANGQVIAKGSGIVVITATLGGKSADIELNVREKLTKISLETSNLYYAVGIARETVFASDVYADFEHGTTKEPNSTLIIVEGEPENPAELADFYSAYKFEIVQGEEYARFDENVINKLVFDGAALEGNGKQKIVVRVSARYPKYETMPHYTTEEVSFYAVYGVQVYSTLELKQASFDQLDYAYENRILSKDFHGKDVYISSSKTYAIVLGADMPFDAEYAKVYYDENYFNEKGEKKLNDPSRIELYGSLYGNNHLACSWKEYIADKYFELFHVAWSDVTFSNVRVRVNTLADDETSFSNDDTKGLWADCIDFETIPTDWNPNTWGRAHLENIRVEYCLLENGIKSSSVYNVDVTYDGCVIRNMAQCALYIRTSMDEVDIDGEHLLYPHYSHVTMHNVVASNLLGTLFSVSYDRYANDGNNNPRFESNADDNDAYMMEHFVSQGYNTEFNQTGFLDLYNWQPASATNMLDTGNEKINALISQAIGALVDNHPQMQQYKVMWSRKEGMPEEAWFHMGFVSTGVSNFPDIEKSYLVTHFEDENIKHFDAHKLEILEDDYEWLYALFQSLDFHLYLYDQTSPIQPGSQVPDGVTLINHLHE